MSETPQPARRRRLTPPARRALIVEAALSVFAERGYLEASMTEIASRAGTTASVIYDHFASKAELQIALLDSQVEELLTDVGSAVAQAEDDATVRMRTGVDAFFRFVEEHDYAWRMVFRDPPTDLAVAQAHRAASNRATAGIVAFLLAYAPPTVRENPEFAQSAEMFAEMIKTAQNGLAVWWYDHRDISRDTVVDQLMTFCWTGLHAYIAERE